MPLLGTNISSTIISLKVPNEPLPVTARTHTRESAAMLFMGATFQIPSLTKTPFIDRLVTEQTLLLKSHSGKQLISFLLRC